MGLSEFWEAGTQDQQYWGWGSCVLSVAHAHLTEPPFSLRNALYSFAGSVQAAVSLGGSPWGGLLAFVCVIIVPGETNSVNHSVHMTTGQKANVLF